MGARLHGRLLLAGLLALAGGCARAAADPRSNEPPHATVAPPTEPRIPRDEGPFHPSLARLVPGDAANVERLADVAACEPCHADTVKAFRASAHARASFDNPWYRSVVDVVRRDVGLSASRHCGGCHDPLLLISGRMDREVEPTDPLATAGVTCLVCHGVTETRSDGNGSYTLRTDEVPIPVVGDEPSTELHRRRLMADPVRSAALCASCHRGFLGPEEGLAHVVPGIDEPGAWRISAHAGNPSALLDVDLPTRDCRACHMAREASRDDLAAPEGWLLSHRFPGGHTPIASMSGDAAQWDAQLARLADAATLDVAAVVRSDGTRYLPAESAEVRPGETITFDVVVRNTGVGHQFPGGVRDMADTYVEVRLLDARGRVVAEAGTRYERGEDETAFVLRTRVLDEDGEPELEHLVHRFRALGFDTTVSPRDARVVRYEVALPRRLSASELPLRVEASLRHRRHGPGSRALACASSRSSRGRAFDRALRRDHRPVLDGCADEPVVELAHASVSLGGGGADAGASRPSWERLFDHALGLSHGLSEHVEDALPSLDRALALLAATGRDDPAFRARVEALRGRVFVRQGRLDDALHCADVAEGLVGPHAALDRLRGDAYLSVWRFADASRYLARATTRSPSDTALFRDLARARISAGDGPGAFASALSGLALKPRDEGLLRTQAMAVAELLPSQATTAHDAFVRYREPDEATELRLRCDTRVEHCARDRAPVPTLVLRVHR